VEWLDRFLADYVFEGEPLDQVLVEARHLGELPGRTERRSFND
jgi:predicted component of type VI protein secretion system